MKKLISAVIIYLTVNTVCMPQSIYFITGHPFRNISTQFPAVVFRLQNDTLAPKLQISNEDLLLSFIKVYPELNIVTALTSEYKTKKNQETLSIIHTDKPDTIFRINPDLPNNMRCHNTNLVSINKSEIYECFDCLDPANIQKPMKERVVKEYGWNVYDFSKKELTPEDYRFAEINGSPASALEGWDYVELYSNPKNGQLILPVTPDTSKRPLFPISLPDSLQINKRKLLAVIINNPQFVTILMDNTDPSPKELGFTQLYIYDKAKVNWFSFKIKGSNNSVRGYGTWLAGSVVSDDEQIIYDEQGREKETIEFNRVSPGKENRRQKGTSTGTPFDFRTDFSKLYYPGILYLLNVPTRKYIEWNTGQGDSEILLVQDELVYYRVNDKIYKSSIVEGKELGKPELLIQDERVPDIHWAFISGN